MPAVTSDILIIGGGVAGVSAGALLAEHAHVHLIEAEDQLGTHSTGRSAAMYITSYGPPVVQAMTKLAGLPLTIIRILPIRRCFHLGVSWLRRVRTNLIFSMT